MTLILLCLQQTKDLKYATRLLSKKFEKMSEPKKAIVRELGFGGLMHIPPMNVPHKLLKELANSFKLGKNTLETSYGSFKIRLKIIGDALGLNVSGDLFLEKVSYKNLSEENQLIFRRFQGNTLKQLTDEMMSIEGNWGAHVLNFIIKGITNFRLKRKKSIDGCLYALMKIYSHLSKNKEKKREERAAVPWNDSSKTDVDVSFESESEEDSEKPTRKQPKKGVKIMESRKRKQILEDSSSESKSESINE
ncbi:hypothetical protein Ahy_A03g014253 [Arachis hypogaea]|uniref:Uncharacterized protein n=1 Tax=Arachis hypogaea TaxID=3818 RepID=A0A445DXA1_ARAHY|nr:hypothetical protein Ahy_A03g014253 [Arachis hypogaea]